MTQTPAPAAEDEGAAIERRGRDGSFVELSPAEESARTERAELELFRAIGLRRQLDDPATTLAASGRFSVSVSVAGVPRVA